MSNSARNYEKKFMALTLYVVKLFPHKTGYSPLSPFKFRRNILDFPMYGLIISNYFNFCLMKITYSHFY